MPEAKTTSGGTVALADTLATKLARIMGQMRGIKKEGTNQAQKYKFVRETDVAEKASELLAEAGIWVEQTVVESSREPLYQTQSGMTMWISKVVMEFRFVDGATGETTAPRSFPGEGADTGDKGIYKAMTGAEKYFLMKSFFVSTGDDPEADEKVDKAVAASEATAGPRVARGAQPGVQRGGKSSVATAAQVNEIAREAGRIGLDAVTFTPALLALTGRQPGEGQAIREFLGTLTFDEAAKLITALGDFKAVGAEEDVHTESTDVDEEAEPDALAVV
jgi:hypothetical protein